MAPRGTVFLEWDSALTLGDETIDRQHRGLVELINELHRHLDSPDRDAQVMLCLTNMYLYAKGHFRDEEAFMERVGYPDREGHAALHRAFVQKINHLTDCCLSDASPYTELLDFLVLWLREHELAEDERLMAFVRAQDAG
jgi:hemerythrin